MAFLRSIMILIFCIGWVKAIERDIDSEIDKIVQNMRNSFENAWKWIRTTANQNFARVNQIFASRQPAEQFQHKYQDVTSVHEAGAKSDDTTVKSENTSSSLSSSSSQITQNTQTSSDAIINAPESLTPQIDLTTTTNLVETPNSEKKVEENKSEITTTKEPQHTSEQPKSDDIQTAVTIETTTDQIQFEKQQLDTEPPVQVEQRLVKSSETQSPASTIKDVGVSDSPAVTENTPESDANIQITTPIVEKEKASQIVVTDRDKEDIDFEKNKAFFMSIYKDQNWIILALSFLALILGFDLFLFSKTYRECPSMFLRDTGGNLNSVTVHHNIKK